MLHHCGVAARETGNMTLALVDRMSHFRHIPPATEVLKKEPAARHTPRLGQTYEALQHHAGFGRRTRIARVRGRSFRGLALGLERFSRNAAICLFDDRQAPLVRDRATRFPLVEIVGADAQSVGHFLDQFPIKRCCRHGNDSY